MNYHEKRTQFEQFVRESLNEKQYAVIAQPTGIMIVHAGAGSGKTRVITARIAALMLNELIPASAIVALTFTNKAAREMKERVAHFLGTHTAIPFVGTFHSYCLMLLKQAVLRGELSPFTIIDQDDAERLLKNSIARASLTKKITPSALLASISRLKNNAITGSIDLSEVYDPVARDLILAYEHEKKISHCYDFDDLLLETLRLLKKNDTLKAEHQARVRHLLVDEYQDTNGIQNELLKEMAYTTEHTCVIDSLTVVGDEDQSIYSWRGALAHTMITFRYDFTEAQAITLEQNYRSVQPILTIANTLIAHNVQRKPKELWSSRTATDRVRILIGNSGYQEAEAIALLCARYTQADRASIAVLYRSHYQSRIIEEAFIRQTLPYVIIGGTQFYDRMEIKDILAYLKLATNPFDRAAFARAIGTPSRGLGDKFVEQFINVWNHYPFDTFSAITERIAAEHSIGPSKLSALKSFATLVTTLPETPSAAIEEIITKTAFYTHLAHSYEVEEASERSENVKELVSAVRALEERQPMTIASFLEEVALLQEHTKTNEKQACVRLMTLHAAKGLEFDTVIIAGVEEGILPNARSTYQLETLEEERRLLYVGITRAQERLLITCARSRYVYGQMSPQNPSRFMAELGVEHAAMHECSYWSQTELARFFEQWLNGTPSKTPQELTQSRAATVTLSEWHEKQRVSHHKFGTGTIERVEKTSEQTFLTVRFGTSSKKIAAQFLKVL